MSDVLDKLEADVREIGLRNLPEDGFYKFTLAAAFVKSYEYMTFAANYDDSGAFFTLGSLRGICEELIVLSFLKALPQEDRDEAVAVTMKLKLQESIERQSRFFKAERSFQPVVQPTKGNEELIEALKQQLKNLGDKTGAWSKKTPMPKVHTMAEELGLRDFYDFFYTLSSETVHYNPRILLRMGWSENDDMENFQFSTSNFTRYYIEYGRVYSALLFLRFCAHFKEILSLSPAFLESVGELEQDIADVLRWPEPVTYEELNVNGPKDFMRLMYKIADKSPNKNRKADA